VAEPRRVLIGWDYGASGIWWCSTKEEREAAYPQWSYLKSKRRAGGPHEARPWSERLSEVVLRDLKAWNESWENEDPVEDKEILKALQDRGRELAIRVQNELGISGWEVLYQRDSRIHRVRPPGSWPIATWREELLGYVPRDQALAEEKARVLNAIREYKKPTDTNGSTPTEP
jgi:hypothetical protein